MKQKILQITIFLLLAVFAIMSCQEEDEWVQIDSVQTAAQLTEYLDSIFTRDNDCLTLLENKSQLRAIFSSTNFKETDSCHQTPEIDFNNYTLIAGKIQVSSISDNIESINLTSKNSTYKIEISIDRCNECFGGIGYLYFWKLYPKLDYKYNYETVVD